MDLPVICVCIYVWGRKVDLQTKTGHRKEGKKFDFNENLWIFFAITSSGIILPNPFSFTLATTRIALLFQDKVSLIIFLWMNKLKRKFAIPSTRKVDWTVQKLNKHVLVYKSLQCKNASLLTATSTHLSYSPPLFCSLTQQSLFNLFFEGCLNLQVGFY